MTFDELIATRKGFYNVNQIEKIRKAFEFAQKAHQGQIRKSGEEYIQHPMETAAILIKMGLGVTTVSAALLHDTYEDTAVTLEEISKEFGKEIAFIVKGVSKLSKVQLKGSLEEYYLDNLRKMFLAMATDIRVVLIKLADRLHNMRTLSALPAEKQQRISRETMEIFVPIANRFGIGELKGELADLCFKYIQPKAYLKTFKMAEETHKKRKKYVNNAIKELKKELKKKKIEVLDIHGRAKHYYSLYRKLKKYDMNIKNIYDLAAIRIVVPSLADCYEALGVVHKKYRPLVGRIKDYISLPKPNGYKSLHTTIFGPQGKILEVQIRSKQMHNEAEFGIAAHWAYAQGSSWKDFIFGKKGSANIPAKDLAWVHQLKEWHQETQGSSDEFWRSLKIDFFKNHIFAFTPEGDVVELPEKATAVDFAYRIHSEIGDRTAGAKINEKMVSLDTTIHNGDLVEILTSKEKKLPSRDWLQFVKTANARSKIKSALRKSGIEIN